MPDAGTTVLITGAGAAGTAGKIMRLRDQGHRVVATDINADAAGLYLADRGYVVPAGDSAMFTDEIARICMIEDVRAIVPLVDEELLPVWRLATTGVEVLLPHPNMVAVCLDKYALCLVLAEAGIPVPATRLAGASTRGMPYPLITKPRFGRGGRGVTVLRTALDAADRGRDALAPDQVVVQEYIEGPEYTVSVVVWRDGRVQAVVPKQVLLKHGSSSYAISRHEPGITRLCREIADVLGADGPFNVQLRVDSSGTPRVFEINPRFSGSSALTAAAGVDEVSALLGQAVDVTAPQVDDVWCAGVAMLRHPAESFTTGDELLERRSALTGSADG